MPMKWRFQEKLGTPIRQHPTVVVAGGLLLVGCMTRALFPSRHTSHRPYRKEKRRRKRLRCLEDDHHDSNPFFSRSKRALSMLWSRVFPSRKDSDRPTRTEAQNMEGEYEAEEKSFSFSSSVSSSHDPPDECRWRAIVVCRCFQTLRRHFGFRGHRVASTPHGSSPSGGVDAKGNSYPSPTPLSVPLLLFYPVTPNGRGAGGRGGRRRSILPFSLTTNSTSMSCGSLQEGVKDDRQGMRVLRRDGSNGTHYYFLVSMITLGMGMEMKRRNGFTEKNGLPIGGEDATFAEDEGSTSLFDPTFPLYSTGTSSSSSGGGGGTTLWKSPLPSDLLSRAMVHCYGGRDTKGHLFLQFAWQTALFHPEKVHDTSPGSGRPPGLPFLPSPIAVALSMAQKAASPSAPTTTTFFPPSSSSSSSSSSRLLSFSLAFFLSSSAFFLSPSSPVSTSSFSPPLPILSSPVTAALPDGKRREEEPDTTPRARGKEDVDQQQQVPPLPSLHPISPPLSFGVLSLPLSLASCGQEQERGGEKSGTTEIFFTKPRTTATEAAAAGQREEEEEKEEDGLKVSACLSGTNSPHAPRCLSSSLPSMSWGHSSSICEDGGQEEVKQQNWSYWALHFIRASYWEERACWCCRHYGDTIVSGGSPSAKGPAGVRGQVSTTADEAWEGVQRVCRMEQWMREENGSGRCGRPLAHASAPPVPSPSPASPRSSSPPVGVSGPGAMDYRMRKSLVQQAIRAHPHLLIREAVQAIQRRVITSVGELAFMLCLQSSPAAWGMPHEGGNRRKESKRGTRGTGKAREQEAPAAPTWDTTTGVTTNAASLSPFPFSATRAPSFVLAPRLRYYIDEVLLPELAAYLTRPLSPSSEVPPSSSTVVPPGVEGGGTSRDPPPRSAPSPFHPSSWWKRGGGPRHPARTDDPPPPLFPTDGDNEGTTRTAAHTLLPAVSPRVLSRDVAEKIYVLFLHLSVMQRGFLRLRKESTTNFSDEDKYHMSLLKRLWMAGTKAYYHDAPPPPPPPPPPPLSSSLLPPLAPPSFSLSLWPSGGSTTGLAFLSSIPAFAVWWPSPGTLGGEEDEGTVRGKRDVGGVGRTAGEAGAKGGVVEETKKDEKESPPCSSSGEAAEPGSAPPLVPTAKSSVSPTAHPFWRALGFPSDNPAVLYNGVSPPPPPMHLTPHDILHSMWDKTASSPNASPPSSATVPLRTTTGKKGGMEGGDGACGVLGLLLLVDFVEKYPQEFSTMVLYNKQATSLQSSAAGKKNASMGLYPPPPYSVPVISLLLLSILLVPLADAIPTLAAYIDSPMEKTTTPPRPMDRAVPVGVGTSIDHPKEGKSARVVPTAAGVSLHEKKDPDTLSIRVSSAPFGIPVGESPPFWSIAQFSLLYDRLWNCVLYKTFQHAFHASPPTEEEGSSEKVPPAVKDTAVGLPTLIASSSAPFSGTDTTTEATSTTTVDPQRSPLVRFFFGLGKSTHTKKEEKERQRRREEEANSERQAARDWEVFARFMNVEMKWWKCWLPPSTSSSSYLSTQTGRQPIHTASSSFRLSSAMSTNNRSNPNQSVEKDTTKLPWSTLDAHQILQQSAMDGFYELHHQLLRHFHVCWVQFHCHAAYSSPTTTKNTLSREKSLVYHTSDSWRTSSGFVKPFIERVVIPTFFFPQAPLFFSKSTEK